jgi:hypothetical protein
MRVMFTIIGGISVDDLAKLAAALPKGAALKGAGVGFIDGNEKRLIEVLVPVGNDNESKEEALVSMVMNFHTAALADRLGLADALGLSSSKSAQ